MGKIPCLDCLVWPVIFEPKIFAQVLQERLSGMGVTISDVHL